jgi:hypothetical protein
MIRVTGLSLQFVCRHPGGKEIGIRLANTQRDYAFGWLLVAMQLVDF